MFLKVAPDGTMTMEEVDDFKRFHIEADAASLTAGGDDGFAKLAEDAGEGHYWLNADAIVEMSGKGGDEEWTTAFWTMLEKAEPYGFSDVAGRRIKAHLA